MKQRIGFLFGAGASKGSGPCSPAQPPLGNELFAEMEAEGLVPKNLPQDIVESLRNDIEAGMLLLQNSTWKTYYPLLRNMAVYLSRFSPDRNNVYSRLVEGLAKRKSKVKYSTLNYDLLLEIALNKVYPHVHYFANPCSVANGVILRKLHGSCGFMPEFSGIRFIDCDGSGNGTDFESGVINVTTDSKHVERWCSDSSMHNGFSPSMSFYAAGKKTPVNTKPINEIRAAWAAELTKFDVYFVVGVACRPDDEHVWKPLAASRARLIYIAPGPSDAFDNWKKRDRKGGAVHWDSTFEAAVGEIIATVDRARL